MSGLTNRSAMRSERSRVGRRRSAKLAATTSTIATFTIPSSHCEGHGCASSGVAATSLSLLSVSLSLPYPLLLNLPFSLSTRRPSSSTVRARARTHTHDSHLALFAINRDERDNRARFTSRRRYARPSRRDVRGVSRLLPATAGGRFGLGFVSRSTTRVERSRARDCAAKRGVEQPEAESPPSRLRT